jgi:hypothetical protein
MSIEEMFGELGRKGHKHYTASMARAKLSEPQPLFARNLETTSFVSGTKRTQKVKPDGFFVDWGKKLLENLNSAAHKVLCTDSNIDLDELVIAGSAALAATIKGALLVLGLAAAVLAVLSSLLAKILVEWARKTGKSVCSAWDGAIVNAVNT